MSQQKNTHLCEYNKLRRPRYFHGMLLDEKDFEAEQAYHLSKRRLLNRMLHGAGVVCGLDLEWKPEGRSIRVQPGLALDCLGNEIWVSDPYTVDLDKLLERTGAKRKDPCPPEMEGEPTDLWLCLYYHDTPSDPVPTYASDDCGGQTCDFSRWKEGFCFKLVDACPEPEGTGLLKKFCECGSGPPHGPEPDGWCPEVDCEGMDPKDQCKCWVLAEHCSRSLPCPDCRACGCEEHCVILGRIRVDERGCLVRVCVHDCRSYVLSGRMVRYLADSLFAGIEEWATLDGEAVPPMSRFVDNPIYGLCWLLRRFGIEGDSWRDLVPPWIRNEPGRTEAGTRCLGPPDQEEEYVDMRVREREASRWAQEFRAKFQAERAELESYRERLEKAERAIKSRPTKDSVQNQLKGVEEYRAEMDDLKQQVETLRAMVEEK